MQVPAARTQRSKGMSAEDLRVLGDLAKLYVISAPEIPESWGGSAVGSRDASETRRAADDDDMTVNSGTPLPAAAAANLPRDSSLLPIAAPPESSAASSSSRSSAALPIDNADNASEAEETTEVTTEEAALAAPTSGENGGGRATFACNPSFRALGRMPSASDSPVTGDAGFQQPAQANCSRRQTRVPRKRMQRPAPCGNARLRRCGTPSISCWT